MNQLISHTCGTLSFDKVKVVEDKKNDRAMIDFTYEVLDGLDERNSEFEEFLGEVLNNILSQELAKGIELVSSNEQNGNTDTEKPDLQ